MRKRCVSILMHRGENVNRKNKRRETPAVLFSITQLYIAVMLAGLPFFAGLGGYAATGEDTFRFFTVVSALYLGGLGLGAVELVFTGSGHFSEILAPLRRLSGTRICFFAYLAWSALSAALSPYSGVWAGQGRYEGLCETLLCVLVFWAVSSYGRWDHRFLWLLGGVLLLNGVLGLIQYAGGNPLGLYPEGMNYHDAFVLYSGRFMGTLGNVDILGAFLSLILPVFYASYLSDGQPPALVPLGTGAFLLALADVDAGYVGAAAALFFTFPIYYTRRSAWGRGLTAVGVLLAGLGLGRLPGADRSTALYLRPDGTAAVLIVAGVLLAAFGLMLRRRTGEGSLPQSRLLWLAIPAGLLAGLAVLYAFPFSGGTLWEIQQLLRGNVNADFGSGRVRIWREVLRLIQERPLLGGGPDTLLERMTFTFTRYSEELGMTIEAHVDSAHNLFLNTAANQGIPALIVWLAGLWLWVRGILKRRNAAGLLMLAGVTGYLAQGCFSVSLCSVTGLFWIFLALGECDIIIIQHKEDKNNEQ